MTGGQHVAHNDRVKPFMQCDVAAYRLMASSLTRLARSEALLSLESSNRDSIAAIVKSQLRRAKY